MANINVAFAANNAYIPHLEIALFSLLKNNLSHKFDIYVLSSDIDKKSQDKLTKICRHFGNADLNMVKLEKERFRDLKTIAHFSRDMYSRYLLPEILANEEKVLYLDGDILVTGDVSELYNQDIDDFYVAGVRDIGIGKGMFHNYLKTLNLKKDNYINSGVLLMNLTKIRRDKKVQALIDKTDVLSEKLTHPDQDVINIVFADKIKRISSIWNFQDEDRRVKTHKLKDVRIIHYTTGWKPWNTPNIARGHNETAHELYEKHEYEYYETLNYLKKISVIIPIYNTDQKYLNECLDSVRSQTYSDLEIILVDDGSKQSVATFLDRIAKDDDRIKVIHKQNAGTNRARQTGFIESTGDYVTFVDGDDFIENNMIHKLFRTCLNDSADMAVCEYWDDKNVQKILNPWINDVDILNGKDAISRCRYTGFPGMRLVGVVWAKLYKRNILEKIDWSFSDYSITEDEFMNIQIFANTDRVVFVRDQLYHYRQQVTTSKESSYPAHNKYGNQEIPMLQTASDLYSKSKELYKAKSIKYNEQELTLNYIAILGRQANQLIDSGNFNKDSQHELLRQKHRYLSEILRDENLTDVQKLLAVVTFDSPESIGLLNKVEQSYRNQINKRDNDIVNLEEMVNSLRVKNNQFLGVGGSVKLLVGNIKRKLRIRTRVRNLIKE